MQIRRPPEGKIEVLLYTKKDCSLCEKAKAVLRRVGERFRVAIREVNIESDPRLLETYKEDIPVVFIAGKKRFKHRVDEGRLTKLLEALDA